MKKQQAQEYIEQQLMDGDSLVGFFQAVTKPKFWLWLLIGPFAVLSMKYYFVAVSDKGIYFHKLSFLGKFSEQDFFAFDEIESVKIGKGLLQRPMNFVFKNSRKLRLGAQLKGVEKIAKLLPDVQAHIEKNIPGIS